MSYTKTQWRNNQSPAINADNLNHIEQGVYDAYQDIALEKTERQQAVTAETLARESTDNNLQAQIDQLVAPSGTAPNPAEIENARIGADGVTYDTLGNAIRTQLTDLKSDKGDVSIEQLRALLPTETVSGDMVSITDGQSVVPADSLSVSLSPIQDLNGYDKPWVGGAGKNKIDVVNRTESASVVSLSTYMPETCSVVKTGGTYKATSTGPWSKVKFGISGLKENQTYTFSALFSNPSGGIIGMVYYKSGTWTGNIRSTATSVRLKITFTYTSDITTLGLIVNNTNASTGYEVTMSEMQLEEGSSQTTFEPYENICPISGHTEVTVTDCGKNLLPYPYQNTTKVTNGITFTDNGDGTITANGTATAEAQFLLTTSLPNSEWTGKILSGCPQGGSTSTYYITAQVSGFPWTMYARDIGNGVTITDSGYANIRFLISIKSGQTVNNLTFKPMICLATEADATYEPYRRQSYTTELGRTVYGGTLDVVSGELVIDRAYVDLGTLNWTYNSRGYFDGSTSHVQSEIKRPSDGAKTVGLVCSQYVEATTNQIYNGEVETAVAVRHVNGYIWAKDGRYTDAAAFKTAMNGVQLVYPLATPQTYQLTPQQISLLAGENHLWSDGEITLVYGADIQLWVEKKLQ